MPAIDGFALQRLVREARPTLLAILVTGRHELAGAATEADRGGRVLFEKPFDRELAGCHKSRVARVGR